MSDSNHRIARSVRPSSDVARPILIQMRETVPAAPPQAPLYVSGILLILLVALAVSTAYWLRRRALRTWQTYAREIGGEFGAKNRISPAFVSGTVQDRDLMMVATTNYEDDAPYYHTRARMPLKNRAGLVLGLRHKSMLEEAQTRKEPARFALEDNEFESLFFVVCNDAESLPELLNREVCNELRRYGDVEIYVRLRELEWRRAGEQADLQAIRRLTALLAKLAASIEALPSQNRTLTQSLADEEMIVKGV